MPACTESSASQASCFRLGVRRMQNDPRRPDRRKDVRGETPGRLRDGPRTAETGQAIFPSSLGSMLMLSFDTVAGSESFCQIRFFCDGSLSSIVSGSIPYGSKNSSNAREGAL